jgi:glycosyltransferase involved in cell wall biosynthesis
VPALSSYLPSTDHLFGLSGATRGCQILHSAETALPITEQCLAVARRSGARVVLTCWENIPFRGDGDVATRRRKQRALERGDRFLAVTERAATALQEEGVARERIDVVPAGVDCDRFCPDGPVADVRTELGLLDDEVIVLFVGRLIQEKGAVELVRAFARADIRGRLLMIGDGDQAPRVRHAAAALGVGERVHLLPHVGYADLPEYLRAADVVVAPSLSTPYWEEQFGMILVETMACGRPLITTASGSIPEVVGREAILVPDYDIDALSAAVAQLAEDRDQAAAIAAAGRRRAVEMYSTHVVAGQIERSYHRALGKS